MSMYGDMSGRGHCAECSGCLDLQGRWPRRARQQWLALYLGIALFLIGTLASAIELLTRSYWGMAVCSLCTVYTASFCLYRAFGGGGNVKWGGR